MLDKFCVFACIVCVFVSAAFLAHAAYFGDTKFTLLFSATGAVFTALALFHANKLEY